MMATGCGDTSPSLSDMGFKYLGSLLFLLIPNKHKSRT